MYYVDISLGTIPLFVNCSTLLSVALLTFNMDEFKSNQQTFHLASFQPPSHTFPTFPLTTTTFLRFFFQIIPLLVVFN